MDIRKITIILSTSLIVFCLAFGIMTRLSYGKLSLIENESTLNIKGSIIRNPILTDGDGLYNIKKYGSINETAEELYEMIERESSLIVTAKKTGLSEIQQSCILTKLDVKKVHKGNKSLAEKSILVYEPVVFLNYGKPGACYFTDKGYTNIYDNIEYILMLDNIGYSKAKILNEDQKNSYKISSMSAFGKYTINHTFQTDIPINNEYKYRDLKDFEIAGGINDDLKIYNYIKKKVLEKYD